jgi:hypothetical protein
MKVVVLQDRSAEGGLKPVRAENHVRAVQAACLYSWMIPPSRSCLRISRRLIWSGSRVRGRACRGAAAASDRWVRGGIENADAPTGVVDGGEDVLALSGEGDGFCEVDRQDGLGLGAQGSRST